MVLGAVVVIAVIAGVIVWAVKRQQWVDSLRAKGWTFDTAPGPAPTYGLNVPPFGLGTSRRTDDGVFGRTPGGLEFASFEYLTSVGRDQVACVRLPRSLPETHLGQIHPEAFGQDIGGFPVPVRSVDPAFGADAARAMLPALQSLAASGQLALTIDGATLVTRFAPTQADPLEQRLIVMEQAAQALLGLDLSQVAAPPVPSEMSVHGRPEWIYRSRDDAALSEVIHSSGGHSHRAEDVYRGRLGNGLPWVALEHHWKTTEHYTDSEGRSQTREVSHSERIMEITAPQNVPDFSVNQFSFLRKRSEFESIRFNQNISVRCKDPRFAHDVVHPRMMEFLEATNPRFEIEHGRFRVGYRGTVSDIDANVTFCAQFLARIPRFVWKNLGYADVPAGLPEIN